MLKDYNLKEELTEEELVNDMDFLRDATTFLSGRQGFNEAISADKPDIFKYVSKYLSLLTDFSPLAETWGIFSGMPNSVEAA